MYTRTFVIALGFVGALVAGTVFAKSISNEDFVTKASTANLFEIQTSKLALEKSQNADIKSFAQQMVDDHGKTGDKLTEVLESSESKATPAAELDKKHQKLLEKLEAVSSDDFDRKYVSMQSDAHKEAVALFTDYSKHGKDKELKKFATETLPTLKSHREHVMTLQNNH